MATEPMPLYAERLSADQAAAIELGMRPGRKSQEGFLDRQERLSEVVQRDLATLDRVGITCEQIADRLESLVEQERRREALQSRGLLARKVREVATGLRKRPPGQGPEGGPCLPKVEDARKRLAGLKD